MEMSRENLVSEMKSLYEEYDYHPTAFGVEKQVDAWQKKKAHIINLFKTNKDYNGRYQIVFKQNLPREIEEKPITDFFKTWRGYCYEKVNELERVSWFDSGLTDRNFLWGDAFKDASQIEIYRAIDFITYSWKYERDINPRNATELNKICPDLRVHAGQKASRVIRKMCKMVGFDKTSGYNKLYTDLADALSPGRFKATIVISCNPIDYLTSAFGNSWTTCATIDKHNKRGFAGDYIYRGLSSGGCGSYMEDKSTFVFYILKGDYTGNTPELEPKIYRNLFHYNGNTLIQGRVYPKSKDGATDLYKEFREIVMERLFPEIKWETEIGVGYCKEATITKGCHYTDYLHFNDCNVSRMVGTEDTEKVTIGSSYHCPSCGRLHSRQESIECEDCYVEGDEREDEDNNNDDGNYEPLF